MPPEAIVTLVIATLIIAAAALGLMRVIGHLSATLKTLRALTGGVDVVAHRPAGCPPPWPPSTPTSSLSATSANRSEA